MLDFITVVIYGKAEPQLALTSPCPGLEGAILKAAPSSEGAVFRHQT